MKTSTAYVLTIIIGISFTMRLANGADEEDLELLYGDQEMVSIATGSQVPLNLAPSIASVVTAEEIKKIGATDLDDILETVPGLHVSVAPFGYNSIYQIRGITSETNPQVLVLINGIPITNVFFGNRGQAWRGMPVENVARVEVIRGPGSAIYGADAFAGVINVISKTPSHIEGVDLGARYGSYDSKEGWLLYGGNWSELDIGFSLEAGETNGNNENIDADAQTLLDGGFGTSASRAPGSVNNLLRYLDTRLDLGWRNWQFRAGYQGREGGTGAGTSQALDPDGKSRSDRFNADLTYANPQLSDNWGVQAQFSFFNVSERSNLFLFPPGAAFLNPDSPSTLSEFPDGVIGRPEIAERHYRADLFADYSGFSGHKIRIGAGFRREDLYRVKDRRNFDAPENIRIAAETTTIFSPLGSIVDIGGQGRFIQETDREVGFAYLQDEWNFLPDWILTAGVRFDHYSDFGGTVNPRFALVWQTSYNLTTKLLYGRAFRAPSFAEQFNKNNPVALGNDDLDPETIDSVELAFDYQPAPSFRSRLNLYWYHYQDIIRFVSDAPALTTTADNDGDQNGYGLELEGQWDIVDSIHLIANYALQRSEDQKTDSDVGFAPTHQIYARLDWELRPTWNLDAQINWVGDRQRAANDSRSQVDDYTTVDLTLLGRDIWSGLGVSLAARNIFDANAKEPSLDPNLIPRDLPLAGRNFFVELRYQFR